MIRVLVLININTSTLALIRGVEQLLQPKNCKLLSLNNMEAFSRPTRKARERRWGAGGEVKQYCSHFEEANIGGCSIKTNKQHTYLTLILTRCCRCGQFTEEKLVLILIAVMPRRDLEGGGGV